MDSEIPLPPPRRIRHRSPATANPSATGIAVSSFQRAQRLSRFDDRSSQPSSDPALFSSDDIPASGLENYHATVSGAGRKRRYRGTWWGEQVLDPKRKRADFKNKRNVDSGVWMGSDESGAESLLPSEDGSAWGEDLRKSVLDPRKPGSSTPFFTETENMPAQTRVAFSSPEESDAHRFAREVVSDCLDKGHESIDLGDFHLGTIPAGLLRPLQHLTKLPSVREAPVSENVFTSLQPFLSIYLPNNSLSALHNDIFELTNLKVLSLRNNKLTEVPSTIRRLTGLEVLNLSVNQLACLPWELLKLMQQGELKHLTVRPNPFLPIEEAQIAEWHYKPTNKKETENDEDASPPLQFQDQESSLDEGWIPLHVATGPITYMDMEGNPMGDSPSRNRLALTLPGPPSPVNYAPSLREVALRAVSKLPYLEQTTDEELAEYPALIVPLLQRAREVRAAGGQPCSVCQREYVIPRAEWMEWWDFTPCENGMKMPRCPGEKLRPLPFRRFGCSLSCVPRTC
ncbi:Leucine-rich repeat, typical subtype [Penicillium expansum]|uniref:Leucine-rich repeat, typical subtype n=1 Tax=Penicillium expansum TaxID=27334 RepID=A0A0A2JNK1_PENEN|nr:Leucine-rich repeat, typical subtype [Penicillium expansum]KGO42136.1 Leucine-rich repeat, typical subtype [Penicillium expansum]KGO56178.1 Leucine-rich repeat, typical subtype [Penicillium expansum]KGO63007.1 Leucine-rich repeat, typical subtype [Penicillium expansum]